mgnify:CR=1 FL=1
MTEINLSSLPQPLHIITEQPSRKKTTWDWLRDIGITGLILGVISGFIAAWVSAYFQHNRWYVEQRLARDTKELQDATETFTKITTSLAKAQALQEILFFTFVEATKNIPDSERKYLEDIARNTFVDYESERISLREKIDYFIFDTRWHLDWASDLATPQIITQGGVNRDPLSYGRIKSSDNTRNDDKASDFNCLDPRSMPQSIDNKSFEPSKFKAFTIDWYSSTHTLILYNYCFRTLHDEIWPARVWAGTLAPKLSTSAQAAAASAPSAAQTPPTPPQVLSESRIDQLADQLSNQVQRLNAFSALGMTQIERTRKKTEPPGFWMFVRPNIWPFTLWDTP